MSDIPNPTAAPPASGVQPGPGSPVFAIAALVAFVIAGLGIFNAFGDTAGIVTAVIAILVALFALVELFVPRKRGGRVSLFTVGVAVLAIVIGGARLGGFAMRHDTGTLTAPNGDTVGDRLP